MVCEFEKLSIGVKLKSPPTYIPIPAGFNDADTISAPSDVKALPMAMERAVPKLCDVNEKSYKSSHEAISLFSTVPPKSSL